MSQIQTFYVIPTIVSSSLNSELVEHALIDALKNVGTVYQSNQNLTETQKQEKYFNSASINFMLGNIGEENQEEGGPSNYLPVLWMSLNVIEGAQILKNHSKTLCPLWKSEYYFADDAQANEKATLFIQRLVQQFAASYRAENPGSPNPIFYFSP